MDLRAAINEFVTQGKTCHRLRSSASTTLTAVDLHVLKAQLNLLKSEIVNVEIRQQIHSQNRDHSDLLP